MHWSPPQKSLFSHGFRRFCGSLPLIAAGIPTKTVQECIEYHFRVKIPGQYRKYQVRECTRGGGGEGGRGGREGERMRERLNGGGDEEARVLSFCVDGGTLSVERERNEETKKP